MVDLGWAGIIIPEQHGGLGMSLADAVPVVESLGRYLVPSPFAAATLAAQTLIACGSEAQQSMFLPKLATGTIATLAIWEPAGSWSLMDTEVTLTQSADGYQLNGTKVFVEAGEEAGLYLVAARLDGDVRLCLVEREQVRSEDITRESVIDETRRSFSINFQGITVSDSNLLPGVAFDVIEHCLLYTSPSPRDVEESRMPSSA